MQCKHEKPLEKEMECTVEMLKKNDLKNAIKEMCSLKVILVVVVIFELKRY